MEEKSITGVVITAIFSLAVSLVSLASSIVVARMTSKNIRILENQKQTRQIEDDEIKKQLQSLEAGITVIQHLKDSISLLMNSVPGSIDNNQIMTMISTSRNSLLETFQKENGILGDKDRKILHRAKNLAISIDRQIKIELPKSVYGIPPNDLSTYLFKSKSELTDHQNMLRDSRTALIAARLTGNNI